MVAGSRWARKKSELACIRAIPSSISGGICDMSAIGGACSWPGATDPHSGGDELLHAWPGPVAAVGLIHLLKRCPPSRAVGQQVHGRRLMRNQRVNTVRVT